MVLRALRSNLRALVLILLLLDHKRRSAQNIQLKNVSYIVEAGAAQHHLDIPAAAHRCEAAAGGVALAAAASTP